MVAVAEWTIAPDCESGFRRIVTGRSPAITEYAVVEQWSLRKL